LEDELSRVVAEDSRSMASTALAVGTDPSDELAVKALLVDCKENQ
jgi:hypothetical protein